MSQTDRQVALVTGASRGIGRAIAVALAGTGRFVLVNYRSNHDEAQRTLEQITGAGGAGALMPFDVTDPAAVDQAVESIIREHSRIDVLVNNAGMNRDMLLVWMKPADWQSVIDVNLTGMYLVTRPAVRQMMIQRSGRVINIVSTSGQTGMPGQMNYSAAKAGVIGATKALAKEVAKRGVTVNAIAPGFIETDMLEGLDLEQLAQTVPMGRLGQGEDVAALAAFLCGESASYITGQVIGVNGGIV